MRISDWSSDVCSSDLLAGIDARRAIFARLIDADHRLGHGFAVAGLPAHSRGLRCRISTKMSAAPASEKSALKPASEMPNSVHCAVSQRTSGAFMIRSEEHTSELQSLMRNSYAVLCLKKKNKLNNTTTTVKVT